MPWELVTDEDGEPLRTSILVVHAGLLPTGEVLLFGGSEHSYARFQDFLGGIPLLNAQLFRLSNSTLSDITQSPNTDLFCCGHAFLGDGRLLAAGGTRNYAPRFQDPDPPPDIHGHVESDHWDGESACWVYNHWQRRWVRVRDLAFEAIAGEPDHQEGGGRWYPTLFTLPSGALIAFGGHPNHEHTEHENIHPETYSAGEDVWRNHADRTLSLSYGYYPRGHVLRDGRIFLASPEQGGDCGIYDAADGAFEAVAASPPGPGSNGISEHEFTTVLLPLLPGDQYRAHVLATGWGGEAFRISVDEGTWQQAGTRDWSGAPPHRRNGCAILLPTGQVALVGGVDAATDDEGDTVELDANAVLRAEIYTPGIDWAAGAYDFDEEEWETDAGDEASEVPRNYHSVALLLPDGRILTAGSNIDSRTGHPDDVAEKRIEMYHPWYIDRDGRPQIGDVPSSVVYGQSFTIETSAAQQIARVAMIRNGSTTHAFDADQRYVALEILSSTATSLTVQAPPDGGVAPPGHYMLWIIDGDGLPCEQAPFVKLGHQGMFIALGRSSISVHDVDSMLAEGVAQFPRAVHVMLDGVPPKTVISPTVTLTMDTASGPAAEDFGISLDIADVLYDVGQGEADTAQRITYIYNLRFADADVFDSFTDQRAVHVRAESDAAEAHASIVLHTQPNPYLIDGDEFWLSTDLRVFKVVEGIAQSPFPTFASDTDPNDYVTALVADYDAHVGEGHPFDEIQTDQEASKLELARRVEVDDEELRVYNFAIARVRYRSLATAANNVRVFFRLFNTVGTALEFEPATSYRRNGQGVGASALIGRDGQVILSLPYFGSQRLDTGSYSMIAQEDATNRKTLPATGGQESQTFFGCWLDFNQTTPRFPLNPTDEGPFSGELRSLQELTRGYHQCLVAEIHFGSDLIPLRATPGSSDKLAQRNLWIEEAPNPGVSAASRVVLATCELRASRAPLSPSAGDTPLDELMIRWNNLPRASRATLYMPSANAADIVDAAALQHGAPVVRQVDDHTVELRIADVTYVPIPRTTERTIPALLRIELPEGISKGQRFRVQVHQFSAFGAPRQPPRVQVASFQLDIPVGSSDEVRRRLVRRYSVLKHVANSIPVGDRWYPIYKVYLADTGERVRGLGVEPDDVYPSPDGSGYKPDSCVDDTCPPGVRCHTGKVCRILYDCFGDFEGFVLDECPHEHVFRSRERAIETLVRRACSERIRVTVDVRDDASCRLVRIALHC